MKRKYVHILSVLLFITIYACGTGINLFSPQDDVNLGLDVARQIQNDPQEYPIFHGDPSIKKYIVDKIFNPILASPKVTGKNVYPYSLEIIDKPDVMNAFALPGGYVYVYTGLLKYLDSDAALAGSLAHEIAHAERRHSTQRMTASYGTQFLLNMVLGSNPSQIAEITSNLFVGFAFLANSRSDENEADEYSFKYLQDTKFYPGGVKFFFEKMKKDNLVNSNSDGIKTFLSTHPDPIDRIASTEERLKAAGLPVYSYDDDKPGIMHKEYRNNILNRLK